MAAKSLLPASSKSSTSYLENPANEETKLMCSYKRRKYNRDDLKFSLISSIDNHCV